MCRIARPRWSAEASCLRETRRTRGPGWVRQCVGIATAAVPLVWGVSGHARGGVVDPNLGVLYPELSLCKAESFRILRSS